jgi:ribosomal protein S18 acetylase RimI-like enzyme
MVQQPLTPDAEAKTGGVAPGPEGVPTYWKVPFEWDGGRPLSDGEDGADDGGEGDDPEGVSWLPAEEDERLLWVAARVLAASPDASDAAALARSGAVGAARGLLEAPPDWGLSRQPGWWTLLIVGDEAAGFVLPVTYDNSARDGLDEATIFHMGVLPDYRGQGLGRALLRHATATLVAHGVWRIYCDTASNNAPMTHLFESEGWLRLPPRERPV